MLLIWAWKRPPVHDLSEIRAAAISNATRVRAAAILVARRSGSRSRVTLLNSDTWIGRRLFHFAIGGMTGWALAWLAMSVLITWHARQRAASTREASGAAGGE